MDIILNISFIFFGFLPFFFYFCFTTGQTCLQLVVDINLTAWWFFFFDSSLASVCGMAFPSIWHRLNGASLALHSNPLRRNRMAFSETQSSFQVTHMATCQLPVASCQPLAIVLTWPVCRFDLAFSRLCSVSFVVEIKADTALLLKF